MPGFSHQTLVLSGSIHLMGVRMVDRTLLVPQGSMAAETLNRDFETGFDIDRASEDTLKITNDNKINRGNITADTIGGTSFKASLACVQYGTFDDKPACLLIFDFSFSFDSQSRTRFTYAAIEIVFARTLDASFTMPIYNPEMEPVVVQIAPVQVYGQVKTMDWKQSLAISITTMLQAPVVGPQVGFVLNGGVDVAVARDKRMALIGDTLTDDDHDCDHGVRWTVEENKAQAEGIIRRFTTAAVVLLPKGGAGQGMKVKVKVKPTVQFSMNPRRLLQKNDDPIFLDGQTPKGRSAAAGFDKFDDPAFPWAEVVAFPAEYEVSHSSTHFYDQHREYNTIATRTS